MTETSTDLLPLLKVTLERLERGRAMEMNQLVSHSRDGIADIMEQIGPALIAELSQLREVVRKIAAVKPAGNFINGGVEEFQCGTCREMIALAASSLAASGGTEGK